MDVITDNEKIEEVLSCGVEEILPSKEKIKQILQSGKRLRVYSGLDPTGPDLHLGHSKQIILLEKLRRLGHEVILLFGDFTAMIGDPSDKKAVRKQLSKQEAENNTQTWKEQVSPLISLNDDDNPASIRKNSQWLSDLGFEQIVDVASKFTIQQMLERDMFENRIKEGKPVWLHEFLYPLMQGYDSVALDVDIEVGGTDQTFNMLAGRTLQKAYHNKEKFIITTTLLEDPNTKEKLMSKSKRDHVSLMAKAEDMYGGVMALPDAVSRQIFEECTFLNKEEIDKIIKNLKNPRDVKMRLAKEITSIFHGQKNAEKAEEDFIKTFQKKGVPDEILSVSLEKEGGLVEALVKSSIVGSKTEARRLISEGAIKITDNNTKITDPEVVFDKEVVLKIGKRRFVRITPHSQE